MGEVIGEKLSSIARSHQVICITHLPQIASYADEQWKVHKVVKMARLIQLLKTYQANPGLKKLPK